MHRVKMERRSSVAKNRSAVACVEFALVLPILLTLVLGVLEIGRYVQVRQIVTSASREGARQAASGQMTNAQVINVVTGYIQASGLPTANLAVTVLDVTQPAVDVSQATQLDKLQVTVSIPYSGVRWSTTNYFTNATTKITATSFWYSTVPQAYPSNITAPTGS